MRPDTTLDSGERSSKLSSCSACRSRLRASRSWGSDVWGDRYDVSASRSTALCSILERQLPSAARLGPDFELLVVSQWWFRAVRRCRASISWRFEEPSLATIGSLRCSDGARPRRLRRTCWLQPCGPLGAARDQFSTQEQVPNEDPCCRSQIRCSLASRARV